MNNQSSIKQYCKYCAYMCVGDFNYCEKHNKSYSDSSIKTTNKCKDFVFNEISAISGEIYKPHQEKKKVDRPTLFDNMEV